ncbi:MAG: hypothetical protein J6W06_08570 [Bacteroidales bacterium]|nr:hypothetical protein [Bacteroidales bacterium]
MKIRIINPNIQSSGLQILTNDSVLCQICNNVVADLRQLVVSVGCGGFAIRHVGI